MNGISDWEPLLNFIYYFERQEIKDIMSEKTAPRDLIVSPRLEKEIENFIHIFYSTNIADLNYMETLRSHKVEISHESFSSYIPKADLELAKSMLTAYIRQEKFCDGLIISAIKNGNMAKILKRIKQLLEKKD